MITIQIIPNNSYFKMNKVIRSFKTKEEKLEYLKKSQLKQSYYSKKKEYEM